MKTFDPSNVIVTVGDYKVEGFGETMLTISRPNSMWNSVTGATGHTCRIKTNDTSAEVTLVLQQCSPSNFVLSELAEFDETQANGGVFTLDISYGQSADQETEDGKLILHTENAYIDKMPDATFASTPQDWSWVIRCGDTKPYSLKSSVGYPTSAVISSDGDVTEPVPDPAPAP